MNIVLLLIPLSIVIAAAAVAAFIWAARRGQFDDLETPPHRILGEDDGLSTPRTASAGGGAAAK